MSIFIPEDIIINILTRLSVKYLSRFRCVCKSWYNLIKNPHFANLQLNHSMKYGGDHGIIYYNCESYDEKICFCVDYDSSSSSLSNSVVQIDYPSEHGMVDIIGSCNGLICYRSYEKDLILWNPYTKDYKKISPPPTEADLIRGSFNFYFYCKYGFGYDSKTDDYKFARMAKCQGSSIEISVYSLKLNLWKTYRDIPFIFPFHDDLVFFEGSFHWVQFPAWDSDLPIMIASFEIGTETFKDIPLPQHFSNKFNKIYVRLLRGCLCLIGGRYKMAFSEVWMMKDYGVHESWTKMFTIPEPSGGDLVSFGCLNLKHSFRNNVTLVQVDRTRSYLYDLQHKKFRKLEINDHTVFHTWAFSGSLVSPNNLGTWIQ
ncbi:F-box protein CPR1-like [Papaver somniferum]|uniref:F-box protein CPR1-like n=1 Tax=Papaver somniferum TaxID=3469 RepID=UPI000E6FC961|nr:F-box protein CPR1-like [Papaver somniferum]